MSKRPRLAPVFWSHVAGEGGKRRGDDVALEQALGDRLSEARGAWPDVEIPVEVWLGHMAERFSADAPVLEWLGGLQAAELYLACGCTHGVESAVRAFERKYLAQVGSFLARMNPPAAFVDDVRQMLSEKLLVAPAGSLPRIRDYSGRGSLAGWLRVAALRTAIDLKRLRSDLSNSEPTNDEKSPSPRPRADPEIDYIKQRYRLDFKEAFQKSLTSISKDQQELLRMHFADGKTLDQLALHFQVHRATIARWVAAARTAIIDEARRLLEARLRLRPQDFDSLAAVMRSQLDLSIPGFLKKEKGDGS